MKKPRGKGNPKRKNSEEQNSGPSSKQTRNDDQLSDSAHDASSDLNPFFIPGVVNKLFPNTSLPRKLRLDYSGYIDLIESTYQLYCENDSHFSTKISLSMFQYYCIFLLMLRIEVVRVAQKDKRMTLLADSISFECSVPTAIHRYLNNIGIVSYMNFDWHIDFPTFDGSSLDHGGLQGHFNEISEATHYEYASFPSPFIAVYRIFADIIYTGNSDFDINWNLPKRMRPDDDLQAVHPTKNLLGWDVARKLGPDILTQLKKFSITACWADDDFCDVEFGSSNKAVSNMPMHRKLLAYVSKEVKYSILNCEDGVGTNANGSEALLPFCKFIGSGNVSERSSLGPIVVCSSFSFAESIADASAAMKFRACKADKPEAYIYEFESAPPKAWSRTLNANFVQSTPQIFNCPIYKSEQFGGDAKTKLFASAFTTLRGRTS